MPHLVRDAARFRSEMALLGHDKKASQTLAAEIANLRGSAEATNATVHPSKSYTSAAKRNVHPRSGLGNRAPRRRPRQAQHRQRSENAAAPSQESNDAGSNTDIDNATASLPRESVSGARRVWGTLRSATCTSVKNSISHLTSVNDFQVKRKFSHSTRSGKDKWWFIIKGDEEVMQSLENKWEPVKLQAGWQLEPCTKPITLSITSAISSISARQKCVPRMHFGN